LALRTLNTVARSNPFSRRAECGSRAVGCSGRHVEKKLCGFWMPAHRLTFHEPQTEDLVHSRFCNRG
jgi:hypothetical protein